MIKDFFNLIFPNLCCGCNGVLLNGEDAICMECTVSLPKTNYALEKNNKLNKLFWGRTSIEMATSLYFFNKKSKLQNLLHQLKYNGEKKIGLVLGNLLANDLISSPHYKNIDYIVPVPLHKNKLKKRKYNQSEFIARGVGEKMQVPVSTNILYRKLDSETQTAKKKYERWENVEEAFELNSNEFGNKNILLIDDVITTGATIEACTSVLLKKNCKVYVATIASA